MPGAGYRADIQGLRAVAVLLVIVDHAELGLPGGFLGVDMFFVVSGFVICRLLMIELDTTGHIDLAAFYRRRARRLLPALGLCVAVVLAVGAVTLNAYDVQMTAAKTAAAATVFVSNLFLYRHVGYFDPAAALNPFLHLWSLSVEEQFYVAFPLLLLGSARLGRRFGALGPAGAVGTITAVSFVSCAALTGGAVTLGVEAPERLAYYAAPTRAWELGVGALAAMWTLRRPVPGWLAGSRRSWWAVAGGMAVAVGVALPDRFAGFSTPVAALVVLGVAAVLVVGASGPNIVASTLSVRPLTVLGDASYAWYLWHWPLIVVARSVWPERGWAPTVAAACSLLPALASTRWVELPLRRSTMVPRRVVRVAVVCVTVPLLAAGATYEAAERRWGVPLPEDWFDIAAPGRSGCALFNRDLANSWSEANCTTEPPGAVQGTVVVLGDVSADSISPAVLDAAGRRGLRTAVWSRANCPLLGRSPVAYPRCEEWNDAALGLVDRLDADVVVVSNSSPSYVDPESDTPIADAGGGAPGSRTEAVAVWGAGMVSLLDRLQEADVAVVVVASVPDYGTRFPRLGLSVVRPDLTPPTLSRRAVDAARSDVLVVERRAVAGRDGVVLVDPVPVLCDDSCRPFRDGRWWYYEPAHLNVQGALQLTGVVDAAIGEAVAGRR